MRSACAVAFVFFGLALPRAVHASDDSRAIALSSLRPDCRLKVGVSVGGTSPGAWLTCGQDLRFRVTGLANLEGVVRIKTAEQALEFVRVFSTEGRWRFSGILEYAEVRAGKSEDSTSFVVSEARFSRCCTAPSVREYERAPGQKAFEVNRVIVDPEYRVYRITEVIGERGDLQITGRERVACDGRKLGSFLMLEH